jgi:Cohesin domain
MFSTKIVSTHTVLGVIVSAVLFFVGTSIASAANILVAPATGSYTPGQTFTVAVRVAPAGASVNAVEASLKFDPAVLSVVSVNKDGSVFSLCTITFGGGSPSPFTAQSNLINITFRAVAAGSGGLSVTRGSVLAADGRGTDVYQTGSGGTYTVAAGVTPPPPTTPTTPTPTTPRPTTPAEEEEEDDAAIIFGDPPRAPEVGSPAFLDPELWYKNTEGVFSWTIPFDVNVVAVELSTSSENQPEENEDAITDPPVDEFTVTRENLVDGIQYLSIKFKNQVGWGAVLNRKIQIDTTPPEPFEIDVRAANSTTGFPLLNFAAKDATSGIDFYEVTIADNEPFEVTPDEAALGYLLKELEDGTYTVRVIAHDKAGNTRESTVAVLITAGWIKPAEVVEETTLWDFLTAGNLFILFLISIIAMLLGYIWYDRKQNRIREEKLRRETREIQDQMEKIFSALRDEIYDQINLISKRPRLSKKEKEAVEGLNQALEVSETLIEKEINDVKTILK